MLTRQETTTSLLHTEENKQKIQLKLLEAIKDYSVEDLENIICELGLGKFTGRETYLKQYVSYWIVVQYPVLSGLLCDFIIV